MKDLGKYYEVLSAPERASLAIEALARGDAAEASRLAETCPHRSYKGPDLRFSMRLALLHRTALAYRSEVLWVSVRAAALASRIAYGLEPGDDQLDAALVTMKKTMSRIRGLHAAWESFCGEIGFNPASALAAYGINFSTLELGAFDGKDRGEPAAPDPDAQADLLEALRMYWKIVEDRG